MGFEQIKVELQDWMGNDRAIANAAWTSSHDNEVKEYKTDEDVERVVKFMATHGHGTPFESVVLRFWYRWPIFVDRQHMTHRIASHNGLSGRYRTMPTDSYDLPEDVADILMKTWFKLPDIENFRTDPKNQKYIDAHNELLTKWQKETNPKATLPHMITMYYEALDRAAEDYKWGMKYLKFAEKEKLITNTEFKRAREVWRGIVPVSGMVERITVMNLRSFANYQKLRNSDHAQPEIRHAAQRMLEEVKKAQVCPVALAALEENGWQI